MKRVSVYLKIFTVFLFFLTGGFFSNISAESQPEVQKKVYAPDNTGINVRDRNSKSSTAEDQSMNDADTDLVAKIRRSILEIDSLSTYGRNIKILAEDGVVTLRGPVRSSSEKEQIEARVGSVVETSKLRSELEVASNEPSNKSLKHSS